MAETEEDRMAREISQEEGISKVKDERSNPTYRKYVRREPIQERDYVELAERSARPQKEIHLKHSYVNQAKQVAEKGINIAGHYAGATAGAVAGAYNKYESWQEKRKEKEMAGEEYEQYKIRKKTADLNLKEREERLRQIQERGRGSGGGGLAAMGRDMFRGRGGGYSNQGSNYFNQYSRPQQGYGMLGGQQEANPLDLGAKMPGWFQQGIGRPQQQQTQGYGQRSYEYPRQGGQQRPTRHYFRDEESHALAERNRELKNKQKQLRKIARRERAIYNREAALEQYRAQKPQQPQQGQGSGGTGNISDMLFGGQ
jgi:hypothetical protein